jgi:hypothetical protein
MTKPGFSVEDLLRQLNSFKEGKGQSIQELATEQHCSAEAIRQQLKKFDQQGILIVSWVDDRDLCGRIYHKPVYSLKGEDNGKPEERVDLPVESGNVGGHSVCSGCNRQKGEAIFDKQCSVATEYGPDVCCGPSS